MNKQYIKIHDGLYLDLSKAGEKSGHKYYKRVPKPTGKGYNYFYTRQQFKDYKEKGIVPGEKKGGILSGIMAFFGFKDEAKAQEKVKQVYESNKKDLSGVSVKTFSDHMNEYLGNKAKWDARFGAKPGEKKESVPKTDKPKSEKDKSGVMSGSGSKWDISLMKKIAGFVEEGKKSDSEKQSGEGKGITAKSLMSIDDAAWDKIGADSGGDIQDSKELSKKYVKIILDELDKKGIKKLSQSIFDKLEDENSHTLNSVLTAAGYFGEESKKHDEDFRARMEKEGKDYSYGNLMDAVAELRGSKSADNFETMPEGVKEYTIVDNDNPSRTAKVKAKSLNEAKDKGASELKTTNIRTYEKKTDDKSPVMSSMKIEKNKFGKYEVTGAPSQYAVEGGKPSFKTKQNAEAFIKRVEEDKSSPDKSAVMSKNQKEAMSVLGINETDSEELRKLKLDKSKLENKALRQFPSSPVQKKTREEINNLDKKIKEMEAKEKTGDKSAGMSGENISMDTEKMRSVKMPKEIKSKGIDSKEYKEWIKENWSKTSEKQSDKREITSQSDKTKGDGEIPKEFKQFAEIAKKYNDPEKSFEVVRGIKGVSDNTARMFRDKYGIGSKTPQEAWANFVKDVQSKKMQKASELQRGTEEESEHKATVKFIADYLKKHNKLPSNEEIYKSIAKDHIGDIPDYYSRLSKMEKEAKLTKATDTLFEALEKAKEMPVGTVSASGYKKMANGKWVKVSEGKKKESEGGNIDTKNRTITTKDGGKTSSKDGKKPGKKDKKPDGKKPGKDEKKPAEKSGLDEEKRGIMKSALKKVANILAEALSGKDVNAPTGTAVEQTGENIKGMAKKKVKPEAEKPK